MSDSEQRQLHVPYREYQSQNSTSPAAVVETDALVDLSTAPAPLLESNNKPSTLILQCHDDTVDLLPDVDFISGSSNDHNITIESPGIDRESQPLLGRLELDVTFNRFPGMS